ncbi:hypothetical protein L1887_08141 [Cichorium endivia]|nr:hypothetical protein L1887_08141 [Cichorium endivia]
MADRSQNIVGRLQALVSRAFNGGQDEVVIPMFSRESMMEQLDLSLSADTFSIPTSLAMAVTVDRLSPDVISFLFPTKTVMAATLHPTPASGITSKSFIGPPLGVV